MAKKKTKPENEKEAFWQRVYSNDAIEDDKKKLRKIYDKTPDYVQNAADISNAVVKDVLKHHMPSSFATRKAYRYKLKAMRESLGFEMVSEIERLLIEQICLTWLRCYIIELSSVSKLRESHTIDAGVY